jgi:hypothetical protein
MAVGGMLMVKSTVNTGNTLVPTLREIYGDDFAADCRADMKLSTLLRENGVDSLSQYLKRNR